MAYDQTRRYAEESTKKRIEQSLANFYSQLQTSNLNINVCPLKDKFEEWHFNTWPTRGKYANLCIHGVFEFPREYPMRPPNIEITSPIVINSSCVIDVNNKLIVKLPLLQSSEWNPTTPVIDILTQLSEVFDITPTNHKAEKDEINGLKQYTCMWCGHTNDKPMPAKGISYGMTGEDSELKVRESLDIDNKTQEWRDARVPEIECSFARVYYEVDIVRVKLLLNNLTSVRVGWCLKESYDDTSGECEFVALSNRYSTNEVKSNLCHKRPYELVFNQEQTLGFQEGDWVVCAADFEEGVLRFFINGNECVPYPMPQSFREGTLIPFIGIAYGHVRLNLCELKHPIPQLSNFLTIEEYTHQNKGQYLWDTRERVEWNKLFEFGVKDSATQKDATINSTHNFVLGIFEHLTPHESALCRRVCGLWNFILKQADRSWKLKCYHTKLTFAEVIIGMMLQVEYKGLPDKKDTSGKKVPHISKFRASSDYISIKAWEKENIRVDSTKEEFTHFLPLVINATYGEKALSEIRKYLGLIMPQGPFTPKKALDVICELLNANIELLSNQFIGDKIPRREQIEHTLSVWCSLHHLLLFLQSKHPEMSEEAERLVHLFVVDGGELRNRDNLPHLGKVLMYLLLAPSYNWHSVRKPLLEEHLARDVSSYITTHRQLEDLQTQKTERLRLTFDSTEKTRRRLMLQFIFLITIGCPFGGVISKSLDAYNRTYGGYEASVPLALQDACEKIVRCKNWLECFHFLHIETSEQTIVSLLQRAISDAAHRGYIQPTRKIPDVPPPDISSNPMANRARDTNGMPAPNRRPLQVTQREPEPERTQPINRTQPTRGGWGRGDNEDTRDKRDRGPLGGRDRSDFRRGGGFNRFGEGREDWDRRRDRDNRDRDNNRGRDRRGGGGRGRGSFDNRRNYQWENRDRDHQNREGNWDRNREGYRENRERHERGDQRPLGQVSEHAAKAYPPEAIIDQAKLPVFLQSGLKAQDIRKWRPVQEKGLPLLTAGEDVIIVSPAGSGKSLLLGVAALYRLYVKKDPAHVIIICGNESHCTHLHQFIERLGQDVPDLRVKMLGERRMDSMRTDYSRGRNIYIGTPIATRELLARSNKDLTENLTAVYLLDCDVVLAQEEAPNTKETFQKIPQGIPCGLFSNSWCRVVAETAKLIVEKPNFIDFREEQTFRHWFTSVQDPADKEAVLSVFCKLNPYKSGLIGCSSGKEAHFVYEYLRREDITVQLLSDQSFMRESSQLVESFTTGKYQYLVFSDRAPAYELWKTQARVIVNHSLRHPDQYAKRMACTGVTSSPVHILSLVSRQQTNFFESVEKICEVEMKELSEDLKDGFKEQTTQ